MRMNKIICAMLISGMMVTSIFLPSQSAYAAESNNQSSITNDEKDNIDSYINSLENKPIASKGEGVTIANPKEGILDNDGNYTIITREKKSINKGSADISAITSNIQNIYPGSLLLGNENLANGRPTPIGVNDRQPIRVSLTLNGMGMSGSKVVDNPNYASVKGAIDEMVNDWAKMGYKTTAQLQRKETMVYNEQQLKAELGINNKASELGIDFKAIESGKKKVMVIEFKQIYFNAAIDPIANPSDLFGPKTTVEQIKAKVNADNSPVIVSNVAYGRTIYAVLETSSQDVNVEAAFKAVADGTNISANASYKQILQNTSFSAYVLGGTASGATKVNDMDGIKKLIDEEAEFKAANKAAAYPISYTASYVKDNSEAQVVNSAEYIEVKTEKKNKIHVHLKNAGAYTCNHMILKGKKILGYDDNGNAILGQEEEISHQKGVCGLGGERDFNISANYMDLAFAFDIKWGTDWPYNKVFTHNYVSDINIRTGGTCRDSSLQVSVDGVRIVDESF